LSENTPSVSLRKMAENDVDLMLQWYNDVQVKQYIGEQFTSRLEGVRWLTEAIRNSRAMALVIMYEGKPVGSLQLHDINWRKKSGEMRVFIGDPSLWDRGIGTQAIRLFIDWLLSEWSFREIYLRVAPTNRRARRVYQKCGFRNEGIIRPGTHADKLDELLLMKLELHDTYERGIF